MSPKSDLEEKFDFRIECFLVLEGMHLSFLPLYDLSQQVMIESFPQGPFEFQRC